MMRDEEIALAKAFNIHAIITATSDETGAGECRLLEKEGVNHKVGCRRA